MRDLSKALVREPPIGSEVVPIPAQSRRPIAPPKAAELAAIMEKEQKAKRIKKVMVDENQLTLFDFVA